MPFDSVGWKAMVIQGQFPKARYTSFITYTEKGEIVDSILDYKILPDLDSRNPFVPGQASSNTGRAFNQTYTITIGRGLSPGNTRNLLANATDTSRNLLGVTTASDLGFVIYRIYVSNDPNDDEGDVGLPRITLIGHDDSRHPLQECSPPQPPQTEAGALVQELLDYGFLAAADFFVANAIEGGNLNLGSTDGANCPSPTCAPTTGQVSFAIPAKTGGYFPNVANKYIASPDLCFRSGMAVVVRGKAPAFPDTINNRPVWQPPGQFEKIDLRYWSMCNNDQQKPFPVVEDGCAADYATRLDASGYYTYIVAEGKGLLKDVQPSWIPADVTWLPWGVTDPSIRKILLMRNMLPASSFRESVQAAESVGCTFDNSTPPVCYSDIASQGTCAAAVMKAYYPLAAYCDIEVLKDPTKGWSACFQAQGLPID
jgi:hypothetical protein